MSAIGAWLKTHVPPTTLILAILAWAFGKQVSGPTLQTIGQIITLVLGGAVLPSAASAVKGGVGSVVAARRKTARKKKTPTPSPAPTPVPAPAPASPSLWARLARISQWPTWLVLALTVMVSAVTVLNQTTFGLPAVWKTATMLLIGGLGYLGIGPVLGPRFKTFVHLPARMAGAIAIGLLGLMVLIQQDLTLPYSAIALGVVQFAGSLGFAPAYIPTA